MIRPHQALDSTPAIAAKVADKVWTWDDVLSYKSGALDVAF
jgi:hypothetical protein